MVLLPADPNGELQAADTRGLAFSASLARLLAQTGHVAEWYRVSGDGWVPGLSTCLIPPPGNAARSPQALGDERVVLVHDAAHYTPAAAALTAGVTDDLSACQLSSRLSACSLQPIRWLDSSAMTMDAVPPAEVVRSMSLTALCDTFGEPSLAWWCASRASKHLISLDPPQVRAASFANPLYKVQYAQVRIDSVLRELKRRGWPADTGVGLQNLTLLDAPEAHRLSSLIDAWPELLARAAVHNEPYRVIPYLRDLTHRLHNYCQGNSALVDRSEVQHLRVYLLVATRRVLVNGLALFGITTPEVI